MTKTAEIPAFTPKAPPEKKRAPESSTAMVVVTCRLPREHRVALTEVWRQDADFLSFSHVVQVAVAQFLERYKTGALEQPPL